MSTINGKIQTSKTNDYGFTSYKVDGTWYGADAKGPPRASEGDSVTFEAFNKQDKKDPDRFYPTIKLATFRKVSANAATVEPSSSGITGVQNRPAAGAGTRDTYWSDKARTDEAKDPRIAYFASSERAIQFASLAISSGCFAALAKAKDTAKLGILEAFVNEQTNRIMAESYAAKVPAPSDVTSQNYSAPSNEGAGVVTSAESESWS